MKSLLLLKADRLLYEESLKTFEALLARGLKLVTAESCTGGLISHSLSQHPGASDVLLGGMVTYSEDEKVRQLKIPRSLIRRFGVVSPAVAIAMAQGALMQCAQAHVAISITGYLGPTAPKGRLGEYWIGLAVGSMSYGTQEPNRPRVDHIPQKQRMQTESYVGTLGFWLRAANQNPALDGAELRILRQRLASTSAWCMVRSLLFPDFT